MQTKMSGFEVEEATVVWFNPVKRFGFARIDQYQQIFFHFNDGRHVAIDEAKDEAVFTEPTMEFMGRRITLQDPVPGDTILFARAKGSGGRSKASPWCYLWMWEDAWQIFHYQNEECPGCLHKMSEHSGDRCMTFGCHCGDEDYDQDDTGGCSQEEPGGITDCW